MDTPRVTLQEIQTQTQAWAEAIRIMIDHQAQICDLDWDEYKQVVFIGCGSTYYLSLSAAALFQSTTGKISRAFPSSELLLNPSCVYPGRNGPTLLVGISRSGVTSETVQAVQNFKADQRGTVLTISNYESSPLARMGVLNFTIPSGKEQSVAQTKSFASMYVACTALSAIAGKDNAIRDSLTNLIPIGEHLLSSYGEIAHKIGQNHDLKHFFFLGSGIQYGLACEASLKMKEMSLTVSEPFHFLEFRHGPISMVDKNTMVVGLLSEEQRQSEQAVLFDVKKLGGHTLALGERNADITFDSGLPKLASGVLYLPVLQLLAYHRAVSFDLNPDLPRNLTAVVELEFPDSPQP